MAPEILNDTAKLRRRAIKNVREVLVLQESIAEAYERSRTIQVIGSTRKLQRYFQSLLC